LPWLCCAGLSLSPQHSLSTSHTGNVAAALAAAVVFAVGVSAFTNQNTSFFTQNTADQALVACGSTCALYSIGVQPVDPLQSVHARREPCNSNVGSTCYMARSAVRYMLAKLSHTTDATCMTPAMRIGCTQQHATQTPWYLRVSSNTRQVHAVSLPCSQLALQQTANKLDCCLFSTHVCTTIIRPVWIIRPYYTLQVSTNHTYREGHNQ
jgi:hypothetical protein